MSSSIPPEPSTANSRTAPPTFLLSPYCRRLRSKKAFFLKTPPQRDSDILDGSGSCWCSATAQAIGPDGQCVHPEDCQSARPCFEAYGTRSPTP